MPTEFDLPCTECGADLQKVSIDPGELGATTMTDSLIVAECRSCGERHYPHRTLRLLGDHKKQ